MNKQKNIIKPLFLKELHYFRGFAILCIVLAHVWFYPEFNSTKTNAHILISIRETLFDGSTIFFVLVSGFLLYHMKTKISLRNYYKSKLKNILSPYIFLSLIIFTLGSFFGTIRLNFSEYIISLPKILMLGEASGPFWYIPFVTLFFVISPFVIKIDKKHIIRIFPYILVVSLFGSKSHDNLFDISRYVYFFPVYLFGVYLSANYEKIKLLASNSKSILIFMVIILSSILFYLRIENIFSDYLKIYDAIIIFSNVFVFLLLIEYLSKLNGVKAKIFSILANYSFAIYFMHDFLHQNILLKYYNRIGGNFNEGFKIIFSLIYSVTIIIVCIAFSMLVKKVIPKYSRYFIGV